MEYTPSIIFFALFSFVILMIVQYAIKPAEEAEKRKAEANKK